MSCPACGHSAAPFARVGPEGWDATAESRAAHAPRTCGRCYVVTMVPRAEQTAPATTETVQPVDIYIPQCADCGAELIVGRRPNGRTPPDMVVPPGWTELRGARRCRSCS